MGVTHAAAKSAVRLAPPTPSDAPAAVQNAEGRHGHARGLSERDLPKPLRRCVGAVRAARRSEEDARRGFSGQWCMGRTRSKGRDHEVGAAHCQFANDSWGVAIVRLMQWVSA